MGLTEKQEKFVECLLSGMTDRQAYYTAYPKSRKWKPEAADVQACILKKTHKVLVRLEAARKRLEAKTEVTPEKIINELNRLASYNMVDVYDDNGEALPINKLPRDIAAAITRVDTYVDKDGVKHWRYTFANKDKSLQLLAQIKGMLTPKEDNNDVKPINISIDYGDNE